MCYSFLTRIKRKVFSSCGHWPSVHATWYILCIMPFLWEWQHVIISVQIYEPDQWFYLVTSVSNGTLHLSLTTLNSSQVLFLFKVTIFPFGLTKSAIQIAILPEDYGWPLFLSSSIIISSLINHNCRSHTGCFRFIWNEFIPL